MIDHNKHRVSLAELTDLSWLKKKYFNNPTQILEMEKGDILIKQGMVNDRMFYIEKGRLSGHFKPEEGEEFQVFSTQVNMIIGIYSFFSHEHKTYTTVKAEEPSVVRYIRLDQLPQPNTEEHYDFLKHSMPVIVNEIYLRQMSTITSIGEKQAAYKKLFESEKMATLGQMAAGLAHELNNAISVIQGKAEWITNNLKYYISEKDSKGLFPYFLRALENGQKSSSSEIRRRRKEIQRKTDLSDSDARLFARVDLSDSELNSFLTNQNKVILDRLNYYWEAGLALHDINVASNHTAHVVQSIKELGARNKGEDQEFRMAVSIQKALSILTGIMKTIEVKVEIDEDLAFRGKEGDFIQIWVNLVKNAAEAMMGQPHDKPKILIWSEVNNGILTIYVKDNGPGIPERYVEKIFRPSFTTKVDGLHFGLGLGLSIVQKIVTSYNGHLGVTSKPGNTVFYVEFPLNS